MKNIILLLVIPLFSNNVISQSIFRNKAYGFEMQSPKNWKQANNTLLLENLENFDVNEESLQKILQTNKGSILLTSYYKYDPKTHPGLIPTIQINVRQKPDIDFEQFKMLMIQSAKGFSTVFSDFTYITAPGEIEISGVRSFYFVDLNLLIVFLCNTLHLDFYEIYFLKRYQTHEYIHLYLEL